MRLRLTRRPRVIVLLLGGKTASDFAEYEPRGYRVTLRGILMAAPCRSDSLGGGDQ